MITSIFGLVGTIFWGTISIITQVIKPILKIALGIFLLAIGLSFIAAICSSIVAWPYIGYFAASSSWVLWLSIILGLVAIIIPLVILFTYLMRLYYGDKIRTRWTSNLFWTWITVMVLFFSTMMFHVKEYSYGTKVIENLEFPVNSNSLNIKMTEDITNHDSNFFRFGDGFVNDIGMYFDNVYIKINKSEGDHIRIEKTVHSQGANRKNAKHNANQVSYEIESNGENIILPANIILPKGTKFRGQHIDLNIYIPEGLKLDIDKKLKRYGLINNYDKK